MRSTKKEVIQQIRNHILECVKDDNENEYKTFEEAAKRLYDEFQRVANYEYNIRRYPNEQQRFIDYLQGIPFNFEYAYWEQKKKVSEWLETNENHYSDQKAMNMYYSLIYRETKKGLK